MNEMLKFLHNKILYILSLKQNQNKVKSENHYKNILV